MFVSILQDIRYGFRSLLKSPVFALAAVLTLALGIGANAAIFSMVNAVLLRPLPYPEPEQLVRIYSAYPERDISRGTVSPHDFRDWRDQSESFSQMTAFPVISMGGFVLTGNERPERVLAHFVEEGFFETLPVAPLLGRPIALADHAEGDNTVAVLSYSTWQARFGGDSAIVGSTITLSDTPYTVIGVMPAGFDYPSTEGEVWVPLSVIPESGVPRRRVVRFLHAVGRLAPGVTVEGARADLGTVAKRLAAEYPDSNEQLTEVSIVPLRDQMTGDSRTGLLTLLGAVGVVLLICCANVANLMLVRAQGRTREFAVRAALGAGRARLARQLLTESALLAAIGGVAGLLLASVAIRTLVATAPDELPRLAEVGIDPTVVAFSLLVSLLTGLVFGLAPAWRAWRGDLQSELKLAGGSGAQTDGRVRMRGLLIVAEVALVVVLVIGAGLLLRSLNELLQVEPGFHGDRAVAMQVSAPSYKLEESSDISQFFADILQSVRDVPGVEVAGLIRPMPLTPDTFQGEDIGFAIVGQPVPPERQEPKAYLRWASDDAFAAMGIPLLADREFDERDNREAGELRGIINQAMAERHFPNGDAVGSRLSAGGGELAIIGVVGNVTQGSLDEEIVNVVYTPVEQITRSGMTLVVRTRAEPAGLQAAVNEAIWAVNPDQTIENVVALDALVNASVSEPRFSAMLVALFAGLALTLAAIGIYGVVANSVAQRNREIGIRMALGACGTDVARWVVGQGMFWVGTGIVIGLMIAAAASRLIASLLYGVTATDIPTYVGAAAVLTLVALAASLIPARRAIAIDPVQSLRAD